MSPDSVYVVVPAYNEGCVLEQTVRPLVQRGYSVVVVDDGSRDDTWERLQELPVHALRHPVNAGQGAALQTGTEFALTHGAHYIVHFDADGQHPPAQIIHLLEPLCAGTADVALGSRFLRTDDVRYVPRAKRLVLRVAVWVNYLFTGLLLTDAHNGLRALTREAAARVQLVENRFAHASEILVRFRENRLRIVEVPTTIRYTAYSMSKGQPISNAVNTLIDLVLRRILP